MSTEKDRARNRKWYLAHREEAIQKAAAWRVAHADRDRRGEHLKSRYGITIAEYDAMLEKQNGVCAICSEPPKKAQLHTDHDHTTGRVRGLLCTKCNTTLYYIEHETWLDKALAYLKGDSNE